MKERESNVKPTPFQQNIIEQIAHHLDEDGYCRMTNIDLGKICSGVKRKRMCKEVTLLVHAGYLGRELEQHDDENYTERRLWLKRKVIADA